MTKTALITIQQIKDAVDAGLPVKADSDAYSVVKAKTGEYLIICSLNGYTIGLHGLTGTKYENVLNGSNFYYEDKQP